MLQRKNNTIFAFVIGVLTIVLVFNIAVCIMAFAQELDTYETSGSSLLNAIEWEDYNRLCDMAGRITDQQREENETIDECCYIAQYYEAASLFRAYEDDALRQQQYQQTMDSSRKGVTTLAYTLDEIDEIFAIK